ncbi:MAG: transposase [Kiritimatiellia bacterium]
MITLTVFEHRSIFGELVGGEARPEIQKSELGEIVARCWAEIPRRYPDVELLASVVMPDHFHGVLFVKVEQERPLGAIVRGFKAGVSSVAGHTCPVIGSIWSPGYHDRILLRRGQFARMIDYVRDNPRRLAVKRAHPDLFRVVRNLQIAGQTFSAIGNHFLLERLLRLAVHQPGREADCARGNGRRATACRFA